ncbi:MAG: hypothetical protein K9L88_10625 [Chromatiaceae bacterium]|nr:hypothetical protein [Chromatiaceae bacterium]
MRMYCTENPDYGFHGTMATIGQDAAEAFDLAAREIGKVAMVDGIDAASWLDTRHGRHFGDDVANFLAAGSELPTAIHQAVGRWLSWNISARSAEHDGLPEPAVGLPYLVGHVVNHAIEQEALTAR